MQTEVLDILTENNKIKSCRNDFPILKTKMNGFPLIYLDNAATTQKPASVIERVNNYYKNENANIHRGVHKLGKNATEEYENVRSIIAQFINAKSKEEIIFTSGATESLNLLANTLSKKFLKSGDEILLTEMEHHANIVPWQMIAEERNLRIKYIPINDDATLNYSALDSLINERTKIVSCVHISNSTGVINDINLIFEKAKSFGAFTILDASQSIQHVSLDVSKLDCDFVVFSGHKVYAPTGIGVLWGRIDLLEQLPPYKGGGDMIKKVELQKSTYNDVPYRFEAGTPPISSALGLGEAINYINNIGIDEIKNYESMLHEYAYEKLSSIDSLKIIGSNSGRCAIHSFVIENIHPNDLATMLDLKGIAVRTGHHCTQPLLNALGHTSTTRMSLSFYNNFEEIDTFCDTINKTIKLLS